jgi:hypothetical protein
MIFPILAFLILSVSFAEDILVCPTTCHCADGKSLMPESFIIKDQTQTPTFSCRKPLSAASMVLAEGVEVKVNCPEELTPSLFERMTSSFPEGCGYVMKKFNADGFRETIAKYLASNEVLCDEATHHSMCTSAVFLAFLQEAKRKKELGQVTEKQLREWSDLHGPAWKYINDQARPDLLLTETGLGSGKVLRGPSIPEEGWPREGDIVQFWRNDNSGHSTIFAGFLKNEEGLNQGICFWSSNLATNGYGKVCEPLSNVNRIIVARFSP